MYFAPYFLIAFAVNFGLLAALGLSSGEPLWEQDARLLGCMVYSALVALVFAFTGLQGTPQGSRNPAKAMAPLVVEPLIRESQREAGEPMLATQPRPSQVAAAPAKGELVT